MKYEVRKIDPVGAARILVIVGLAVGLIVGFILLISVWLVGGISGLATGSTGQVIASLALGVVGLVGAPIIFGVLAFLMGYIGGGLYNFFANWYGGVTVDLEEKDHDYE